MKPLQSVAAICIAVAFLGINGCQKTGCTNPAASNYDPSAKKDNGKCQIKGCTDPTAHNYNSAANTNSGCVYYGKVVFYLTQNWGMASVNVGDSVGHITVLDSTSVPACGAAGCATFSLPIGTYIYGASALPSKTWYGSVTVGKDSCTRQALQ